MSTLRNLLQRVEQTNPQLATDLALEVKALSERRGFGLNFERHTPESIELPGRPIRRGDKVRLLPQRGSDHKNVDQRLWHVKTIHRSDSGRVATLVRKDPLGPEDHKMVQPVEDLVVVAEFRDPIYPGLLSTGRIERGGDNPFHAVINAENFHALQALLYAYEGKVDAIYIDPPYNSGARDWKYNNDYVDNDDSYRHSKWLAFMERRLKLAKRLLAPQDSVLIVTIDEREVHRLGLLLEQTFPGQNMQMVSIVINHRGVARAKEFTRVEEYAFFVFSGTAGPCATADDLLTGEVNGTRRAESVRWEWLIKGSNNALRCDRPNLFYPIHIDPDRRRIVKIGNPIPIHVDRTSIPDEPGLITVWPISMTGDEKRWQCSPNTLRSLVGSGMAKVGAYDRKNDRWSILYLNRGQRERIERGEIAVTGRDENDVLQLQANERPMRAGMSVWNRPSHNAGYYGSGILSALIPGRKFPFPKSLYAVEDCLRFVVGNKPNALILDFFAGSGTTMHAVARLNHADGGRRRSILVTNNEVSADEESRLRERGLRPGDPDWEALGICEFITKPRIRAAVTGRTAAGDPVKGEYKFTDECAMAEGLEENVEFFTMTYEAHRPVAHNRSFEAIAPLLWLKAGAQGSRIDRVAGDYEVADTYGVLFDMDASGGFLEAIDKAD
ncbi:DNA methyltransferase, partial [Nonomuraea sp. NPDC055795]